MWTRHLRDRSGKLLFWLGVALLLVFVGMTAYQRVLARRARFASDEQLLAELARATFLDDEIGKGDDWPGWRGRRRDGITTMPDLLRRWPERGPKTLWKQPGGDGYSSFAVRDGRAFTMLAGDAGKEDVVCWDLATGDERWRYSHVPGASFDYGGPRATPTLVGDRLFAFGSAGTLMCLAVKDGAVIWERDLREDLGARVPRWGFAGSPLVEDGRVHVMAGGTRSRCLAAFDQHSGKLLWASQDDPAGYGSAIGATIAGVRQILHFTGKRLLAVTPDAGDLLWEYPWPTRFEVNAATPVVIRAKVDGEEVGYVFLSSGYDQGCALVKIDKQGKDGFTARRVYESSELCCHFASPVRRGDHVYAPDETRDLTCLDLRTGKVAWRFAPEGEEGSLRRRRFQKGSLIRVDDVLIVLGEDGKLALVEATPEEYREIAASRPFRDRCWAMPVLAEGKLLLRDRRQVWCLDVRTKKP